MKSGFSKIRDDSKSLNKNALSLEASIRSWAARIGYPLYINAQKQRWITQNASEGATWKSLSPSYLSWKTLKQKQAPEQYPGGKRVLVLTGSLFNSVTGKDKSHHKALFLKSGFSVSSTLPYAKHVNEVRPFVGFGDVTNDKIKNSATKFITSHIMGRGKK